MSTDTPETKRPLRADAQRNRDRVLAAARTAFAQGGPDVAVSEILRLAGVGSGTLFRHFPTKHDLLLAVLEQTFDEMTEGVAAALAHEDPWEGLTSLLSLTAELQARDQAFLETVGPELFGEPTLRARNEAMLEEIAKVVERGRAAGVVRADLAPEDVPFIIAAVGGATQKCTPTGRASSPELWRRYLGIILDGLRPQGAHPLPQAPPTIEELRAMKEPPATPAG